MNPRDHQLFKQFPLAETATLSTGTAPAPYHIYDGYGLFIGGRGDATAVKQLLADEAVVPVETVDGHAVMGIWVCNFTEASLGPHHELQFSFFVTRREAEPIASHPLNAPLLMLTRPEVKMLCHGLWNNTPDVVAYNREMLSLNAQLTDSHIEQVDHTLRFTFSDSTTDRLIFSGVVNNPQRVAWRASGSLMAGLGMRRAWAIMRQPWVKLEVLNPRGVVLDRNAAAQTFTSSDVNVVRYFDHRTTRFEFGDTPYRALSFTPQCVQYMAGFKFVYLPPGEAAPC